MKYCPSILCMTVYAATPFSLVDSDTVACRKLQDFYLSDCISLAAKHFPPC